MFNFLNNKKMKKFAKVIALAVLMICGGQAMAQQTRGALMLGASFPMKDFAAFEADDFALATDGDEAGAAVGFNLGFKWYFNVGVPGLGVMLSVDGLYNGLNDVAKSFYKDRQNALDLLGTNAGMTTSKYFNVPAMLGVNYIYRINPSFAVYVEAGAGGNARFITNYQEKYTDLLGGKHNAEVSYKTTFGFAWQVGAGIEVAKNLLIGASFYNLGETPVSAEKTGDILLTPMPYDDASIRPMVIMGRIGFSF